MSETEIVGIPVIGKFGYRYLPNGDGDIITCFGKENIDLVQMECEEGDFPKISKRFSRKDLESVKCCWLNFDLEKVKMAFQIYPNLEIVILSRHGFARDRIDGKAFYYQMPSDRKICQNILKSSIEISDSDSENSEEPNYGQFILLISERIIDLNTDIDLMLEMIGGRLDCLKEQICPLSSHLLKDLNQCLSEAKKIRTEALQGYDFYGQLLFYLRELDHLRKNLKEKGKFINFIIEDFPKIYSKIDDWLVIASFSFAKRPTDSNLDLEAHLGNSERHCHYYVVQITDNHVLSDVQTSDCLACFAMQADFDNCQSESSE